MQYYKLIKPVSRPLWDYFITRYNMLMRKMAEKSAKQQCLTTNKGYYGAEMFGSIVVISSVERDDMNRKVPKGNKMHYAEFARHQVFRFTPESLRKKNT